MKQTNTTSPITRTLTPATRSGARQLHDLEMLSCCEECRCVVGTADDQCRRFSIKHTKKAWVKPGEHFLMALCCCCAKNEKLAILCCETCQPIQEVREDFAALRIQRNYRRILQQSKARAECEKRHFESERNQLPVVRRYACHLHQAPEPTCTTPQKRKSEMTLNETSSSKRHRPDSLSDQESSDSSASQNVTEEKWMPPSGMQAVPGTGETRKVLDTQFKETNSTEDANTSQDTVKGVCRHCNDVVTTDCACYKVSGRYVHEACQKEADWVEN